MYFECFFVVASWYDGADRLSRLLSRSPIYGNLLQIGTIKEIYSLHTSGTFIINNTEKHFHLQLLG